ncbi:MAG: DUF2911 domain-containing protein [Vicinamibacterales bacterium]
MRQAARVVATVLTVWGMAAAASAQQPDGPKPSQLGSVTQEVHKTVITVKYSRPVARGREIWGTLVPYGPIWTPGANDATELTVSTDVTINGQKVPAGTYTVWSEPGPEKWTVFLNTAHPVFHIRHADVADKDLPRVTVTPRQGTHMETLAWYFPVVDGRKAELVLHWGMVVAPLAIEVP